VNLHPARTGRPRTRSAGFARGEPVVVSARLPAELAALVYASADENHAPVSSIVAGILADALQPGEVPPTR